ncbi:uncharacterized protein BDV17DRAFT_185578 [Aspergillus undulatus]|uniref:uncharacterized protein n=1 Tax=Aspergillus undulatus TaxID=1810928 RepID=UPI003CCCC0F3
MPMPVHHRSKADRPEKKVDDLVHRYRRPQSPSRILLEVLNDPDSYAVLIGALRRQISLVKCRSQDFEDGQVTAYDRALLILSNFGESVTDPGALELYLTEFLGVVPIASFADGKEAIAKHVELQNVLDRVKATHENRDTAAPAPDTESAFKREGSSSPFNIDTEYERLYRYDEEDTRPPFPPAIQAQKTDVDDRVTRLLEVYQKAKDDYFTTKERDGFDSLDAVRFLRDSAENTLRYLHANGLQDNLWVPDLEQTFATARDKTAQLLGGRKRHFDEDFRGRKRSVYAGRRPVSRKRARRIVDSYRPRDGH